MDRRHSAPLHGVQHTDLHGWSILRGSPPRMIPAHALSRESTPLEVPHIIHPSTLIPGFQGSGLALLANTVGRNGDLIDCSHGWLVGILKQ